jgi:uncharacterized protein YndB with AHSA1/START domain
MAEVRAQAESSIDAPVERVFALISDPARRRELLPEAYHDVNVAASGDTVLITYTLHAGGRQRDYAMRQIPVPDSSLREEDEKSSLVTVWTLTPSGGRTDVSITTTWQGAGGIGGFFEKTFAPKGVARLHTQTLGNLGRLATA